MENYLITELEKGRSLKILFISHKYYWYNLEKLNFRYRNCNVEVADISEFLQKKRILKNYDIIYCESSYYFNKEYFDKLTEISSDISENEHKRVSILYSFAPKRCIHFPEYAYDDFANIVSFKDNIKYIETVKYNRHYTLPIDLTGLVLKTHDELENQKIKIKQNKN